VKTTLMLLVGLAAATPAAAQDAPALSIRPFVMGTEQSLAAKETFKAAFDTSAAPFVGGGVQVVFVDRFVAEIGASRFRMTGQRAFRSGGQNFRLGIPLVATITPVEVTGGYRFALSPRVRPYAAAGVGSYAYKETSDFADAAENVDTRKLGFVLNGGVEFRLHRWIGAAADVQYSRVRGILGDAGVSQQAGEHDLGGVAVRFKLVVGR
jgi:outer membrane protein W